MKRAVFVVVSATVLVAAIAQVALAQPAQLKCRYEATYDRTIPGWRCKTWFEHKRDQAVATARDLSGRAQGTIVHEAQRIQAEPGVRNLQCLMRGGTDCYK